MAKNRGKKAFQEEFSVNEGSFAVSLGELLGKKTEDNTVKNIVKKSLSEKENNRIQAGQLQHYSLQRQTAGRGGKTVTLVVFPKNCTVNLEMLAKEMRKALGCGAHVEENSVVLQGDIAGRAEKWLEKREALSNKL